MFNIIIEKCPESVNVSGHFMDIETDFRSILKCLNVLETYDEEIAGKMALKLFFKDKVPIDMNTAIEIFEGFIQFNTNALDETDESIDEDDENEDDERFFDLMFDSNYIYCAFKQVYDIDLSDHKIKMHWWKFKTLLSGLPNITKMSSIIEIRSSEMPKDPKYRSSLVKLKEAHKLPNKDKIDGQNAENLIDTLFRWAVE